MITDEAYILHKRAYQDSSELLKIMTQNHGVIDAVVRGSRKPRSKFYGQLMPFIATQIALSGRSELKTLTAAEQTGQLPSCQYLNHVALLYCNELIVLMKLDVEATRDIYSDYVNTTHALLNNQPVARVLRDFEWRLCCVQGYELVPDSQLAATDCVQFDAVNGLHQAADNQGCQVQTFTDFIQGRALSQQQLKALKPLMQAVVNHLVGGRPIQSRALLK